MLPRLALAAGHRVVPRVPVAPLARLVLGWRCYLRCRRLAAAGAKTLPGFHIRASNSAATVVSKPTSWHSYRHAAHRAQGTGHSPSHLRRTQVQAHSAATAIPAQPTHLERPRSRAHHHYDGVVGDITKPTSAATRAARPAASTTAPMLHAFVQGQQHVPYQHTLHVRLATGGDRAHSRRVRLCVTGSVRRRPLAHRDTKA